MVNSSPPFFSFYDCLYANLGYVYSISRRKTAKFFPQPSAVLVIALRNHPWPPHHQAVNEERGEVIRQNRTAMKIDPKMLCKMLQFGFHPLLAMVKTLDREEGHFLARNNNEMSDLEHVQHEPIEPIAPCITSFRIELFNKS